jgi:C-terminal processing protease CtpA/Prc
MHRKMLLKRIVIALALLPLLYACKDKTVDPATDSKTNEWILSNMQYWYYWNDKLPANTDMTMGPSDYFSSLLYKYDRTSNPNGDRFSWIQESADELTSSLNGKTKTTGLDYRLVIYPSGSTNVVGIVLYILPGSPAAKAGFKRGDIFTHIDDQKLTTSNYTTLLRGDGPLKFTVGTVTDAGVITEGTTQRTAAKLELQEDPIHFDTLYQNGSNKVGYIVYHQFVPGPDSVSGSKAYDQKLDNIFAKFKSAGVNSLILDLRYNGGGYVSSATNLASLMGKVTNNDVFYYKEYNSTVTPVLEKQYGASFFYEKFQAKSQNIGQNLTNLVIITSKNSASASELLINGLKPFMNVTLVGDVTYGKNVGSITITGKDKGIKWGMQPIVTKSFNSLKKSDYSVGFTPTHTVIEGTKLYPYGSLKDPLLATSMNVITGAPLARSGAQASTPAYLEIGSSIGNKAGGSNMFFDR